MKCIICGKDFKGARKDQICCSKECSKERRRQKKRGYASTAEYKEWNSKYQKEYRERNLETIREYKKEYSVKMKDFLNEKKRIYYIENRERLLQQSKEYYASHKEQKALYDGNYRIENAERLKKYFREYRLSSDKPKIYRIKNCEKLRLCRHVQRIKKYGYDNIKIDRSVTKEFLYIKYNGKCCICGEMCNYNDFKINENGRFITGKTYPTIDHIIPISKGGNHTEENTQLAHFSCNCKKGNRL